MAVKSRVPSRRLSPVLPILLLAIGISGCSHIGFNESTSIFISRYTQYMWGDVPSQYLDIKNPLPVSTENVAAGRVLYQAHCQTCHRVSASGDGPAGKVLQPRPANLALTRRLPLATDSFFFWSVSEGGKSLDTEMPAFGGQLSDNEIWQLIHYIKNSAELHG